jgi:hypothetical protein
MTTALNSTPDRSAQSAKRDLFLALANEIEANRRWVDSLGEWELRPESQRQVRVRPPDALRTKAEAARKLRKPTLASVAKQASKAGIEVSRYEVKPDGTVVAVVGKPESATPENPWPLDEFRTKETKQ